LSGPRVDYGEGTALSLTAAACHNSNMLVLASASPRRRELLLQAGFSFEVRPAHIPEEPLEGEDPFTYVTRLAREKAQAVYRELSAEAQAAGTERPDGWYPLAVLGADTTVTLDKATAVRFLALSDEEIAAYVASGEPMDKAGSYAIQGRAARWIPRIEGCYFNVVGLPLALVSRLLESRNL